MDASQILPHINAALNSISTVLLLIGFVLIKRGDRVNHPKVMKAAVAVSAVFLAFYLVYHFTAPVLKFPGEGWTRPIYFTLMWTHIVLATAAVPMIAVTVTRALKGDFERHRQIARWTWPVWIYVTFTGVVIYVILYHVYGATPPVAAG
ncbi:MAG: hypothetical protein A2516_03130 [Alphaproteobacteria bacterium RIFOXYD12_FULL_60_8]|nr:MAG: hypothetical protein A2516_03130 [Alphaproteobacteria bacterium RIFOXYD12_FULL_60_8]